MGMPWQTIVRLLLYALMCDAQNLQAVEAGRADVMQKLIDFNVQLGVRGALGNTPLHLAVKVKVG